MNHAATPSLVEVPEGTSIPSLLADRVGRTGHDPLLERRDGDAWTAVSAHEFDADVLAVARGLVAHGIEPGDRVAIMSRTRYEWTLLDFAIWTAGAVPVPVYETSSPEQVHWILADARVKLAVVETRAHADAVGQVDGDLPELEGVLVLDGGRCGAQDAAVATLRAAGRRVSNREVVARRDAVGPDDLATIVYTSGSTGRPKGAELTHRAFCHLALNARVALPDVVAAHDARTLLFLPLAHVFARLIQVAAIAGTTVVGHTGDVKNLVADLRGFRPTYLLAVPRVFEKVYNSAEQSAGGGLGGRVFAWGTRVATAWSRALDDGGPGLALRLQHALADRLVLARLRAAMGGRVRHAISGGAPLGERLGHFYRGAGLTILEGYGLTETTAPTAVNLPGSVAIGTVGPPFPGTEARISDDGEVQVRGPHVMRGYANDALRTAEAFDGDWFRTGDLGHIDARGNLRLTGRAKEILVTAGGKNVAPAPLEDAVRSHALVSQVVAVGDERPFVAALVTLDAELLPRWLAARGLPPLSVAAAREHPAVLAALQEAVDAANTAVSRAEQIRAFRVLDGDLTESSGYLTPSMKVRRALVVKDFAAEIDAIYA
ncbi:AMP-dependent synthetase/ligase [Isoptericola sp. S6320L]|uniref:AMP-dependent synthetase/ligase n=1 Tax=Isoptericola sp. S6320L TaxID=2926411 RepID=UPI001FF44023|nr:AMP-dependent synthetase/ligase [Isoptericola sp. S6320L]MCK0117139.1 AMP-dependent synthetase/ligase [Isoptericola sp. S6320L]